MENNNNSNWGCGLAVAIVLIVLLFAIGACSSDSKDDYRRTLESGQRKYYTGEKMTREEYNAVKSFNNWKSKQGSKSYSDWNR